MNTIFNFTINGNATVRYRLAATICTLHCLCRDTPQLPILPYARVMSIFLNRLSCLFLSCIILFLTPFNFILSV